eukprot:Selendium_serpulae@DN6236_c4_g1_i1.p2
MARLFVEPWQAVLGKAVGDSAWLRCLGWPQPVAGLRWNWGSTLPGWWPCGRRRSSTAMARSHRHGHNVYISERVEMALAWRIAQRCRVVVRLGGEVVVGSGRPSRVFVLQRPLH